ncbi:MAG: peptide ABC transporter permease [Xanthomonadales bacterium]|nr:peptide ABC transporter permease [Xanthomonadales bacterium]
MTLFSLARGSLSNRRASVALTVLTIAIAIALLVLVEQMRSQVREGFYRSVSGTDLIVGAPTSSVQLLLFSVFGLGDPTSNVSWERYREIAGQPIVDWSIPISLGDAHQGYRVVGTTDAMFEHYRYAGGRALEFRRGGPFSDLFDVVVGARAAERLGYAPGDEVVLAHGGGNVSLHHHDELPFVVSGVLAPTGTPVDQSLYIRLEAHHAIHVGWEQGVPRREAMLTPEQARARAAAHDHDHGRKDDSQDNRQDGLGVDRDDDHDHDDDPGEPDGAESASNAAAAAPAASLQPDEISAFLLGLKTRAAALGLQYRINQQREEPLLAILPGIALQQLWRITGLAEKILRVVAGLVVLAGLLGMLTALLTTLGERRREMAILRACGARPWQISALLLLEAAFITLAGIAAGLLLAVAAQFALAPWLLERFGIAISFAWPAAWQWLVLAAIALAGVLVALVPAAMVYRRTLADGMQVRQ